MGSLEGSPVRLSSSAGVVGTCVGRKEGCSVGRVVGEAEGSVVGLKVGSSVGARVGYFDGESVKSSREGGARRARGSENK